MSDNQQEALENVYNYIMNMSDEKFDFAYCGKIN